MQPLLVRSRTRFESSLSSYAWTRLAWALLMVWPIGMLSQPFALAQSSPSVLAGTERLEMDGDIASALVDGVDRFLLNQLSKSVEQRIAQWPGAEGIPADSPDAIQLRRAKLQKQLGMVDPRLSPGNFQVQRAIATGNEPQTAPLARTDNAIAEWVKWPVFEGVDGEGILVLPSKTKPTFCCVLVPDAGQFPEQLCGFDDNIRPVAFEIAQRGGIVIIPTVLSRTREARNGRAIMTDQEFIYRAAFVLGRHMLGYQVQEILSAVDIFKKEKPELPVMVAGWGEGGWIAMHAAAVDQRIELACISGHFGPREQVWNEPIHRNVQGLLSDFGDAQLAAMINPRTVIIDAIAGPDVTIAGDGGAPGTLTGPTLNAAKQEFEIAQRLISKTKANNKLQFVAPNSANANDSKTPNNSAPTSVAIDTALTQLGLPAANKSDNVVVQKTTTTPIADAATRRRATVSKWDRFQQRILESSANERQYIWDKFKGVNANNYNEAADPVRRQFRDETIGDWKRELAPFRPRTRLIYDNEKWTGYEVVLDVFDEVIAFGVLLLPKDGKPIEHRPCVVFQHGLEGRPADTIVGNHDAYHDVSVQLVEQGYVVFAPQNLYLFRDRFRTLQRKSNPLGRTLFSVIVPQHQQIVNWLSSRSEVDAKRIAFYGLSYGGKSAMRIPALVPEYCLSICSADFNDWVWKNASTASPYSYVWTMEYEIFEFGLGRSFNYAEMAALIAPRPFMVERGHFDGVAPDERVALEFAKVKRHYTLTVQKPDDCQIEFFNGPHTIHGKGTFEFLSRHLDWPRRE